MHGCAALNQEPPPAGEPGGASPWHLPAMDGGTPSQPGRDGLLLLFLCFSRLCSLLLLPAMLVVVALLGL